MVGRGERSHQDGRRSRKTARSSFHHGRRHHGRCACGAMIAERKFRRRAAIVRDVRNFFDTEGGGNGLIEAGNLMGDAYEKVNESKDHQQPATESARLLFRWVDLDPMFHWVRIANPPGEHYHISATACEIRASLRVGLPHKSDRVQKISVRGGARMRNADRMRNCVTSMTDLNPELFRDSQGLPLARSCHGRFDGMASISRAR